MAVGAAVSLIFCTLVQMLFGELVPKNLSIAMPESIARALATSTHWYLRLFGWLISLFDQSSNLLLRALRMEPVHDVEQSATARDLAYIVAELPHCRPSCRASCPPFSTEYWTSPPARPSTR